MSISPYKTFVAGEVLTAADLNASFLQITNAGISLVSPLTSNLDFDGNSLILDGDADSYINAAVDDVFLVHLQGVDLFKFNGSVASPVNGMQFNARPTGQYPYLVPIGADASIAIGIRPTGAAGVVHIDDSNGNEIIIGDVATASAVNEITVTNAATGNRPRIAATGGDTNISLAIRAKGTGGIVLEDKNGNEVLKTADGTASAVNEVTVQNAATGNGPEVQATGGDTDITLNLVAKGAGLVAVKTGPLDIQQAWRLTGDIADSISGNQNNYAPTGLSAAARILITADAARSITGLTGGTDGRRIAISNVSASALRTVTLSAESGSSTAANRFGFLQDFVIEQNCEVELEYDGTASRWRLLGNPYQIATQTFMESAASVSLLSTPGRQQHHPTHPKAGLNFTGATPTTSRSHNVTSVADDGTGLYTPTFTVAFSDTTWYYTHGFLEDLNTTGIYIKLVNATKTTTVGQHRTNSNGTATDLDEAHTVYWGDA